MTETVWVGNGQEIIGMPRIEWEKGLVAAEGRMNRRLGFMSREHHAVREFVVRELPRRERPLTPEWIGEATDLTVPQVVSILDDLERNKTFLFRDTQGDVAWAYPVTVNETPHRVFFDTGERVYAA